MKIAMVAICCLLLVTSTSFALRIDAIVYKTEYVDEKDLDTDLATALAQEGRKLAGYEIADFAFALRKRAEPLADKGASYNALMAMPELIPESTRMRLLTKADVLVVVPLHAYVDEDGVKYIEMQVFAWDARGASKQRNLGVVDLREKTDRPEFLSHAARELLDAMGAGAPDLFPELARLQSVEEVVGNADSRVYHTPTCHHLPAKPQPMRRDAAEAQKYRPCLICFPPRGQRLPDAGLETSIAKKLAGEIEYLYRVRRDDAQEKWVQTIGGRVVEKCGLVKRRYLFTVLDTEEYNAFAAGDGYIYVTAGTLQAVESDDELAVMLARQVAHTELRHPVIEYKKGRTVSQVGKVLGWITGRDFGGLTDFTKKVITRGYSRDFEFAADRMGVIYAKRAGYDGAASYAVLGKLKDLEEEDSWRVVEFMRAHPKADDRINALKEAGKRDTEARQYFSSLAESDPGLAAVLADDDLAPTHLDAIRAFVDASVKVTNKG